MKTPVTRSEDAKMSREVAKRDVTESQREKITEAGNDEKASVQLASSHKAIYISIFVFGFISFISILFAFGTPITLLSFSLSIMPCAFAGLVVFQHAKRYEQIKSSQNRKADDVASIHATRVMETLEKTNLACSRTITLWEQTLAFCREDSKQEIDSIASQFAKMMQS